MGQTLLAGLVAVAALTGAGSTAAAQIAFDPPALTFATTQVGYTSAPQTVTVHNLGSTAIRYVVETAIDFASSLDNVDCNGDPCFLPAGGSLTVTVAFAPRIAGPLAEQLSIVGQATEGGASLPVQGMARGPQIDVEQPGAEVTLALDATRLGTTSAPGTIRIRNIGNDVLQVAGASLLGSEARGFVITSGPRLPLVLDANAETSWRIACRPVRIGGNVADFTIENDSGVAELRVPVGCLGTGGAVSLDPPQIATTMVGSSSTAPLVVHNIGNLPLIISAFTADDPAFRIAPPAGGLPTTLAANAAATFTLSFAPTTPGPHTARLTIADDGVTPLAAAIRGVAHTGQVDVAPAAPDAGTIALGATATVSAALVNDSDQRRTLMSVAIADPAVVQIDSSTLIGTALDPDATVPLTVQVTAGALGPIDTTVSFVFDQGPATTVHVTAVGGVPALTILAWDDTPTNGTADFSSAPVPNLLEELVTLRNTGPVPLHITACVLEGDDAFSVPDSCELTIAPGGSNGVTVLFAPRAVGSYTSRLTFASDASNEAALVLVGEGIEARAPGGCSASGGSGGGLIALLGLAGLVGRRRARRGARAVVATAIALAACSSSNSPPPRLVEPASTGTIRVKLTGTGAGTVRTRDSVIDCRSECTTNAPVLLQLTARPDDGSIFIGWGGPCSGTDTCTVAPTLDPIEVTAQFERLVKLTVTAVGASEITVDGAVCPQPCSRVVISGTPVTLDVFTVASFTGWSGACSGTSTSCALTVDDDTNIAANIARSPGEMWTQVVGMIPTAVTPTNFSDDAVVAGIDGFAGDAATGSEVIVAYYTFDGQQSWSTQLPTGSHPVVVGLGSGVTGPIYVLSHADDPDLPLGKLFLHQLDISGALGWTVELDNTSPVLTDESLTHPTAFTNRSLAVAPTGEVLITAQSLDQGTFVRAYARNGTVRWTQPFSNTPIGVFAGGDGTITVPNIGSLGRGHVARLTADGAAIASYDLPELPSENPPEFVYRSCALTSNDQLVCYSNGDFGFGMALHGFDGATGAPLWALDDLATAFGSSLAIKTDGLFDDVGGGGTISVDSNGVIRELFGRHVTSRSAPDHTTSPGGAIDYTTPFDVAAGATVFEVGSWTRGCVLGDCRADNIRSSGFIRSFVLP